MSRRLFFTVDADRDVNIPLPGTSAAGSIDRGSGTRPRFSSSERGAAILADLLDDLGMEGTFFVEGRTAEVAELSCLSGHCIGLHGYDHEDLVGKETGVVPDVREAISRGYDAVSDRISRPECFRAPYMSSNDQVTDVLRSMGIKADSSVYTDVGGPTDPYDIGGIMEYPVTRSRDSRGKVIAAYLWPMHEGKRGPDDYIDMASSLDTIVLATHTWHMIERRDVGVMDEDWIRTNADDVRTVLEGILDMGFRAEAVRRTI